MVGEEVKRRELETRVLEKVGHVITSVTDARYADQVICALHSLAVLLFPIDSHALSGSIDEKYRDEVLGAEVPSTDERSNWWQVFYGGASFPTLARVLLYDVVSNWLACFPISTRKHVYDVFFVRGRVTEVVQTLVSCLQQKGNGRHEISPVCSNAERLLVLCLLENDGIVRMASELVGFSHFEDISNKQIQPDISRMAQFVTSIPDKAQVGAPTTLSSHLFFKQITIQLLAGAEEWDRNLCHEAAMVNKGGVDGFISFIGEVFARICRRGSADVLLSEVITQILQQVRNFLLPTSDRAVSEAFESRPGLRFWLNMLVAIKDPYAIERMSEQLLHQLATLNASDVEAYWILWILFHRVCEHQTSIRSMFVEKFLLRKVFPVCCLRWILQFSVLECPPGTTSLSKGHNSHGLLHTVQGLLAVWSRREFVQSAPIEHQAYITAAVGLSLEKMSKEDLDRTKDAMQSVLQGVSCRLESPVYLVRKMASSIALVFSKVIDPKNPLYLDDICSEENIDWEFGLPTPEKGMLALSHSTEKGNEDKGHYMMISDKKFNNTAGVDKDLKGKNKNLSEFKLIDPDEIIDLTTLNTESVSDDEYDEDASETSETSSDSSLQPYDLSDDDADLKRKFSQLVDVVGAIRKSDDADGVERALYVAEKLVRASPDELRYVAGDLVRTLVQELTDARSVKPKTLPRALISTISETQPWFMPSTTGPPGAGSWKEVSGSGTPLNWSYSYERELPTKPSQVNIGKTRRWSIRSANIQENQLEWSQNQFPQYAAAFMLPAMQGFDKKRHGVDLLGRDFIVLGKLIYMLGVCIRCASMHPEASALVSPLLDMLSSREISHHVEAYVRRSVLFAASCILVALHPSYIASALVEGKFEISKGLEWIRMWALHVAESDTDRECYTMAMTCLQLHAEMALQASRAIESAESASKFKSVALPSNLPKGTIKIPHSIVEY
ncbi:unnamed protein product [Ilex paraguariensis]|uniref:Telomere length regulation protein conserved domain-containing protein n=1 Tax=Ilex paraguariensis TaxID=185542 RepID=A0ABC8TT02_9AQUA